MSEPLNDTDKHGLATLARRWTPSGMVVSPAGQRFMDTIADSAASALNIGIDAEKYLPIIYNASRCLDADLDRILQLNGIDVDPRAMDVDKRRRLAVLGPVLRAWRGAFRSHRAVAGAMTGGAVIIRTYIALRAIVDISTMDIVLLDASDQDTSQMFILGQGPSGTRYDEGELLAALDQLAKPVLDVISLVACYALTAWRDGLAGWTPSSIPVLVTTTVQGEFEAMDMGVDVDPFVGVQSVYSPTERPATTAVNETLWSTVWFKSTNSDITEYWEHSVYSTFDGAERYTVRVYPHQVAFVKYNAGVPTLIATHPLVHVQNLTGDYQRLDLQVRKTSGGRTKMRAYMNMDPSFWYQEPAGPPSGRPAGTFTRINLDTATTFTAGRLRTGAITAVRTEGN